MGCQPAIADQRRAHGGAALFALQANHTQAYTAVKQDWHHHSAPKLPWRDADHCFDAFDHAHGRRGRRRVWTMTDRQARPALAQWPGLHAVIAVETMRMAHTQAPGTRDYRFSLASLVRSATACVTTIRQPWDSEPKLHGSFEVTFNAERYRLRKDQAPENVAAARPRALHLLRQEHVRHSSLRQKRLLWSLDEHYLLTVLSGAT